MLKGIMITHNHESTSTELSVKTCLEVLNEITLELLNNQEWQNTFPGLLEFEGECGKLILDKFVDNYSKLKGLAPHLIKNMKKIPTTYFKMFFEKVEEKMPILIETLTKSAREFHNFFVLFFPLIKNYDINSQ